MRYGSHITVALFLALAFMKAGVAWSYARFIILGMLTLSIDYIGKTMFKLWSLPVFHNLFTPSLLTAFIYYTCGKQPATFYAIGWILHILLDLLKKKPKGVKLFFPFSNIIFNLNIAEDYSKLDNLLLSLFIILTIFLLLI